MNSIRKACTGDIQSLATLLGFLFEQEAEFSANFELQSTGLKMILDDRSVGDLLVAENDESKAIIGMASLLYTVSTAMGGQVALLEDVVVHPDERGKGIGSMLVGAARDLAVDRGCKRITLLTDFDDLAAERFYQKHGFTLSPMVPLRQILN